MGENVKPIYYKARPLPYAMRTKVDNELKRLEENGIIEPVKFSDWAAPVVPVLKPNGDIRLCGDYKVTVNRVSKLEHYPIPTLDDLTTKLAHGTVYHKLDLSHAYLQVELDPESRKYVTVNTHKGLYQYTRFRSEFLLHQPFFSELSSLCSEEYHQLLFTLMISW